MIIHELNDDGIGIGGPLGLFGMTRCGAIGEIIVERGRELRCIRTSSGAEFRLSRVRTVVGAHPLRDVHQLQLEPTTCRHCRRLAKRRTPRQVPGPS